MVSKTNREAQRARDDAFWRKNEWTRMVGRSDVYGLPWPLFRTLRPSKANLRAIRLVRARAVAHVERLAGRGYDPGL